MGVIALADIAVTNCTAKSFRCADARSYNNELRECCRSHVVGICADVSAALSAAGVAYWTDYGTLLGAVRNSMTTWADYPWLPQGRATAGPSAGIVPHDKDADWGFFTSDWATVHRAMYVLARRKGYDLVVRKHSGSIKVRLSRLNHTNLDLFGWNVVKGAPVEHTRFEKTVTLTDGTMYRPRYVGVDKWKGKEFHRDQLLPLTTVQWEGTRLPAPVDPEAFLAFRYGAKWRTPIAANHDGALR